MQLEQNEKFEGDGDEALALSQFSPLHFLYFSPLVGSRLTIRGQLGSEHDPDVVGTDEVEPLASVDE